MANQKARSKEQLQLANERLTDKNNALARVSAELQDVSDKLNQERESVHNLEAELRMARKAVDEAQGPSQSHMEETAKLKNQLETEQARARQLEERARSIGMRYEEGDLVR